MIAIGIVFIKNFQDLKLYVFMTKYIGHEREGTSIPSEVVSSNLYSGKIIFDD